MPSLTIHLQIILPLQTCRQHSSLALLTGHRCLLLPSAFLRFNPARVRAPTISGSDDRSRSLAHAASSRLSLLSCSRSGALDPSEPLSFSLRLRCQLAAHLAGEKTRSNQLCISRSQTKSDTLYLIATFNAQISLLNKLLFSNCEYPLMQGCPVTFDQK